MAWIYVRNDGTATGNGGRYLTQQTGDWDTTFPTTDMYYASLVDAFNLPAPAPTANDFVMVSSIHDHDYGAIGNILIQGPTDNNGDPAYVISVDDTDIAEWLPGGREENSADIEFDEQLYLFGLTFETDNEDIYFDILSNAMAEQCEFIVTESSSRFEARSLSCVELNNCIVRLNGANSSFIVNRDSALFMNGGAVRTTVPANSLFSSSSNQGGVLRMDTVDLTDFENFLWDGFGDNRSDSPLNYRMYNCPLNQSVEILEETFFRFGMDWLLSHCGKTNAESEYQFFHALAGGSIEAVPSSSIIRDETIAYPSGEKTSLRVITADNTHIQRVFRFNLSFQESDFSTFDTIRIYFAVVNTVTLTNSNCWAEVKFPDATNPRIYNEVSNRQSDFWNAGTEHQLDIGSTWLNNGVDLAGFKEYYMDVDLSGDNPGSSGVPEITVAINIPDVTVYFDPVIGQV